MIRRALPLALLLAACATAPPRQSLQFDRTSMDPSVGACTDFYQFTNGGWLAANPVPPQYTAWSYGSKMGEENRKVLRAVLEAAAAKPAAQRTPNEQRLGDYYASCIDTAAIDAAGLTPIEPELNRIATIGGPRDLQSVLAHLQSYGFAVPFAFRSASDAKNSSDVIAEIGQAGLGLPDREYYFKTDERSKQIREEYVRHVAKMLELAGSDSNAAAKDADAVMRLETALAAASMTRVEQRDPNAVYNRLNLAQLGQIAANIDWPTYLAQRHLDGVASINVAQPKFLAEVSRLVEATPLADWKAYLRWQLITNTAASLTSAIDAENFRFRGTFLRGQKQQQERWQRCAAAADAQIGEALAQAWLEKKFSPEAKRRATELVGNLVAALREDLQDLDWMSEPTRKEARVKLEAFARKIGYPDTWRDYSAMTLTSGPYATNFLGASAFETARDLAKVGRALDRGEWLMTPPTINAYYNPPLNEIVFPAGILQWPMFDINQDDAFNYGAIGSVIGHEISHGFDDEGSQYDARGNLRDWWTAEDRKRFEERAECIVRQFNCYEVEPGLAHNGKLVAGESIADLGGLIIAWHGWKKSLEGKPAPPVIDGFTPEQRFFLGFARARAGNRTIEATRVRIATDPHPESKFRTNGPLSNMPEFATAFGCKAGQPMVREDRCEIW
jgi:putative endopeptidase